MKRLKCFRGFFSLCVMVALFSACRTMGDLEDEAPIPADPVEELERLEDLYKDALRVPISPQIVKQIRDEKKEQLLEEIRYYPSVNIVLVHDRAGSSSLGLETQELRRPQGDEAAPETEELTILTFQEGGSTLNQSRISRNDGGQLAGISPEGDVFEINYPDRRITLGFVLNPERNWYDLDFAIEETGEGRVPLALTGARPHLLIHYRTVFPSAGETRIQMNAEPAPVRDTSLVTEQDPALVRLPPSPAAFESEAPIWPAAPVEAAPQAEIAPQTEAEAEIAAEDGAARPQESRSLAWAEASPVPVIELSPIWESAVTTAYDREVILIVEEAFPDVPLVPVAAAGGVQDRAPGNYYIIQVGAFQDQEHAALAYAALEQGGFSPIYECHQNLTRVVIPEVEQKDLARTRERIKALGFGEPYLRQ
jgi:hypothetical protein